MKFIILCIFIFSYHLLHAADSSDATTSSSEDLESYFSNTIEAGDNQPSSSVSRVQTNQNAFNPAFAVIGFGTLSYLSDSGELSALTSAHAPKSEGFNLQEIEIAFQASVDPYFRGDVFFAFGNEGVEIEEFYLTTLMLPYNLQIRAGKILAKMGRLNTQHLHLWEFVDSPLMFIDLIAEHGLSEYQIELSYLLPFPIFCELSISLMQGQNEIAFNSGLTPFEPNGSLLDFAYLANLKTFLDISPDSGLEIGLSAAFGNNASGYANLTSLYNGYLYYKYKPSIHTMFSLTGEFMLTQRSDYDEALSLGSILTKGGLYIEAVYRFLKVWKTALRVDLVGLPDQRIFATLPEEVRSLGYKLSFALTNLLTEFSQLRLQYSLTQPQDMQPMLHEIHLQLGFSMGAHGAHAY